MTFVGREDELRVLSDLADADGFRMVVVYGRRRVGKTALISRFCEGRRTLSFTAREQSTAENLRDFSKEVYRFFGIPETAGIMSDWSSALDFVANQAKADPEHPFVFVFDEFPYAAATEKSLPSVLQIAIDHAFKDTNVTMILCGSNEGFMESEVLGSKSPLYGRRNAQIRLKPFDIFDATKLMPSSVTWEDKVNYYAVLGGTPYYLEQLRADLEFQENIERLCFSTSGLLYEEPSMLMRQELREPALYNSLLNAIGAGRTTPKKIADASGIELGTVGAYLKTLESLGLIERALPFGENPARSRKGLWRCKDPFFAYWYRFVSPASTMIERGLAHDAAVAATSGATFATHVGQQFEDICLQWLIRQCRDGLLDFHPTALGSWWGTDPATREQTDIDIVMADSYDGKLLLGESKWRNTVNETEAIDALKSRSALISGDYERSYYLFTKKPANPTTRKKTDADSALHLVDAKQMFA